MFHMGAARYLSQKDASESEQFSSSLPRIFSRKKKNAFADKRLNLVVLENAVTGEKRLRPCTKKKTLCDGWKCLW